MDLTNNIFMLIGDLMPTIFNVYFWNKMLGNKKVFKKKENIFLVILATLIVNITSTFLDNPLRMISLMLLLIMLVNYLTKGNTIKSIILIILSQTILALSEFSFAIIGSLILGNKIEKIIQQPIMFIFLNIYVSLISLLIMKSGIPTKVFNLFYNSNKKNKTTLMYLVMIVIIMTIATIESYREISFTIVLITNITIMITFMIIVVKSTIINEKYGNINKKYQTSITSLKEYETMIDKFRVNTHENKNELLTIRNMIKNNDKKTVEYIDTLVDNKIKDNEKIMYQTSKIPEGGLRATIYSKLCIMDKQKINYKLNISKDVRTVDLINLSEDLILNICKILGVFLDNAIEAVNELNEKNINIELYVINKDLYIDITNNYSGTIDFSKLGTEKQTTKGNNHGYGLMLVNKIINENSQYLENERKINGNNFTQSLIVKNK